MQKKTKPRKIWHWQPPVPIHVAPIMDWPFQPLTIIKFLCGKGYIYSSTSLFIGCAIISWFYLLPPIEQWATFSISWILPVFLLNLSLLVLYAGSLHLYFHTFKFQAKTHKFEEKELDRNNPRFSFNNQVYDNIFWCCVSGIPIGSAWQVLIMWAYANGYTPWLDWSDSPILFIAMFIIIALLNSMHFYWIHRLIHWPPLFHICHKLHHRNINVGPWSGISMHPTEHIIYFSAFAIHLLVLSHPIHLFYHVYLQILAPASSHTGFADLQIKNKSVFPVGDFFHQLHHKYFNCNYGTSFMPWDKWFGSFHDGTEATTEKLRQKNMQRIKNTVNN